MTEKAASPPAITYPVIAVSRDNHFFHASGSKRKLQVHALADAKAWTSKPRTPSTQALDVYDASGRVLATTVGQGWLVADLHPTGDAVDPAELLARLDKVARYVAARAPEAVEVPVPRGGETLRPYLKRLVAALEAKEPTADAGDSDARHQRGSLHNLLHAIFG